MASPQTRSSKRRADVELEGPARVGFSPSASLGECDDAPPATLRGRARDVYRVARSQRDRLLLNGIASAQTSPVKSLQSPLHTPDSSRHELPRAHETTSSGDADAADDAAAPASPMSPSAFSENGEKEQATSVAPVLLAPPLRALRGDSAAVQITHLFQHISDNKEREEVLRQLLLQCAPQNILFVANYIQPALKRDFIASMPVEIRTRILMHLDPLSLVRAARVCRSWRAAVMDESMWRSLLQRFQFPFPLSSRSVGASNSNRQQFRDCYELDRNWRTGRCTTHTLDHDTQGTITCLALDRDYIFTAGEDKVVKVWSATSHKVLHRMEGHAGGVWALQYENNWLVSGSTDRTLRVWDVRTGKCLNELLGHSSTVRCLQIQGDLVVSGSRDSTLRVWNLKTGRCERTLRGHTDSVRCVEVHSGVIVSGSYDATLRSWDLKTGELIAQMNGHKDRIYCLAYDGRRAASGSQDHTVRVWNPISGECIHVLEGQSSNLVALVQLRGDILVSGNADSSILVWDIATGKLKYDFEYDRIHKNTHAGAVTCLQFDEYKMFSGSDDGCLKMWDMKTGRFIRNVLSKRAGEVVNDIVWRLQFDATKLVAAYQSNQSSDSSVIVMDFDVDGRWTADASAQTPQATISDTV